MSLYFSDDPPQHSVIGTSFEVLTPWLREMLLIMALRQLLCSSDGTTRKTAGIKEAKQMNITSTYCWLCKSTSQYWCGLTHLLSCIHEYTSLQIHKVHNTLICRDTNTHTHKQLSYLKIQYKGVMYINIPAVCVAVAVDMALTGAARSRTLQHVFMHGQNWQDAQSRDQRKLRKWKSLRWDLLIIKFVFISHINIFCLPAKISLNTQLHKLYCIAPKLPIIELNKN